MEEARLIIAASARDADLYYASRFHAPDPFPFFQVGRERVIIVSDLELGRARSQAAVETVLPLRTYEDRAKGRVPQPTMLDAVEEALRERGIGRLLVPGSFPAEYVDKLRDHGFTLRVKEGIFFEERLTKSEAEVAWITEA
ncbi:MAG: M24 family metallopeptidase, partial [Candidatus Methylomirabilales bacterium]